MRDRAADVSHRIPKIDTLVPNVARLVRLRDIVWQEQTTLVVRGLKGDGDRTVGLRRPAGRKRVSTTFAVPGYPGAKAKLVVFRALAMLRPLVEEERTREERERARSVESRKTRRRLDALRYRWNKNVLEIGARHPSLKRYLGPKSEQYPEQDALHFRVLLAEVVEKIRWTYQSCVSVSAE